MRAIHPTQTPEYWDELARQERAFARSDRRTRTATVESIRIHEENERVYQLNADALRTRKVIAAAVIKTEGVQ